MEVGSSFFWLHCRLFIFVEVLVEFDKLCIRQPNPNNYCDSEASCFVQERPNMAQNWHFCSFWARPCWLIWCPFGGLVGGCGARAVSRKTPIYFIYYLSWTNCFSNILYFCNCYEIFKQELEFLVGPVVSQPSLKNLLNKRSPPISSSIIFRLIFHLLPFSFPS